MTNFPISSSTLSASHLGDFIQQKYGLSHAVSCQLFRTGINHSYIVSDGEQKYVFRVYSFNWRSAEEIGEELRLLDLLKKNGVSVSYPIQDQKNNYIQYIPAPEGLRYAVLFSFADGKKLRKLSSEMLYTIGLLIGSIHKLTLGKRLKRTTYNANKLTTDPYLFISKYFSEELEEMQFIKQIGPFISTVFEQTKAEELRTGILHLDIWNDNMHIQENGTITIFDFDFCGNGWLLHDIAYFMTQLFHAEADKTVYESKLIAFFEGYESVCPISEEEKRLLPYSGLSSWIFYLGVQARRFDNWSNFFFTEIHLQRFVGMIKVWLDYYKIEVPLEQ